MNFLSSFRSFLQLCRLQFSAYYPNRKITIMLKAMRYICIFTGFRARRIKLRSYFKLRKRMYISTRQKLWRYCACEGRENLHVAVSNVTRAHSSNYLQVWVFYPYRRKIQKIFKTRRDFTNFWISTSNLWKFRQMKN